MLKLCALSVLLLAGLPVAPVAAQVLLSLPLAEGARMSQMRYACDNGTTIDAQYVETGPNSLALLTPLDQELLFVGVIAGSGVRYVSNQWEWWTKGDEAMLTDARNVETSVTCERSDDWNGKRGPVQGAAFRD